MKKQFILSAFQILTAITIVNAQQADRLTLKDCYLLAQQNYPLVKQRELIAKTSEYTIDNIKKGYLPQFSVSGDATYQSAVTTIPIKAPGINIPALSKNQYKLYGEADQVLYDGGEIAQQTRLQRSAAVVQQQQLATELYLLKDRINQLFFGILMMDEQLKQNDLVIKDIQIGLNKIQAAVKNGIAFRSNGDAVMAELLKTKQHDIELHSSRRAYADMLGLFTAKVIDDTTTLLRPAPLNVSHDINRPELHVYDEQDNNLGEQDKLLNTKTLPRLGLFFQGGAGRPALNQLSNNFDLYYIGGVRLTWSPSIFYTLKKQKAIIGLNRQSLSVQKETFLFNTNLTVRQQDAEIGKYQQLLASDDEIINLRTRVKAAAMVQLENGVITGNDFLTEVNDEDQARQSKILHEVQLLMAQYNQQTTTGN